MKQFIFSVIIPFYKVEKYIRECILSVINQSIGFKEHIQIILVNDFSPENEKDIVNEFITLYPENILLIEHTENKGLGEARNTGIKYAMGTFLHFVDSDDIIYPKLYETALKALTHSNADVFTFAFEFSTKIGKVYPLKGKNGLVNKKEKTFLISYCYAWMRIFHRDLLAVIPLFPQGTFEDIPVIPFISYYCKKEYYCSTPFYYYRERNDSIVKNAKKNKIELANFVYWKFYNTNKALIDLPQKEILKPVLLARLVFNYLLKDSTELTYKEIVARLNLFRDVQKNASIKKIALLKKESRMLNPLFKRLHKLSFFLYKIRFYFPLVLLKKSIYKIKKIVYKVR